MDRADHRSQIIPAAPVQRRDGPAATPGKQTAIAALQRAAGGEVAGGEATVRSAAARGVETAASPLPHLDTIQRAFGRHDISGIQAHVGADAAGSARAMGADAYATGNHVVLGTADLGTVAHEAAHVVQQRAGISLKGGVGQAGDAHERHADAVAEHVVQGKSAEGLLDQYAGGAATSAPAGAAPTQCKLTVNGAEQADVEAVWARIKDDPRLATVQAAAKSMLAQWIEAAPKYKVEEVDKVSSDRQYPSDEALIRGLAGDVHASANLAREGELAQQTLDEGHVNATLAGVITKIQALQKEHGEQLPSSAKKGRYGGWAYPSAKLQDAVMADPGDLHGRIAMIADYALAVKGDVPKKNWNFVMTAEQGAARATHWNTNEESDWVGGAREHQMPLSAGPSATTAQVLALASLIGCSVEEKTALAWALFTLWNGMPLNLAGTHRFHEVMDVAALHGVPYERFAYGAPPKPEAT